MTKEFDKKEDSQVEVEVTVTNPEGVAEPEVTVTSSDDDTAQADEVSETGDATTANDQASEEAEQASPAQPTVYELLDERLAKALRRSTGAELKNLCTFVYEKLKEGELEFAQLPSDFYSKLTVIVSQNLEHYSELCTTKNANMVSLLANRKASLQEYTNRLARVNRDVENHVNFANEKTIKTVISPLLETLNTALTRLSKDQDNAEFQALAAKLQAYSETVVGDLAQEGIKQFGVVGEKFDPNKHDAVAQYPAPNPDLSETIAYVNSRGYELNGRVVIPASVVANNLRL